MNELGEPWVASQDVGTDGIEEQFLLSLRRAFQGPRVCSVGCRIFQILPKHKRIRQNGAVKRAAELSARPTDLTP